MNPQWNSYAESSPSSRQARYVPHNLASPQQPGQDVNSLAVVTQDPYTSPSQPPRTGSMALASPSDPQRRTGEYNGDGDGDVRMEDADSYNKPKYGARPGHQHRHSQQFLQQEQSEAARRYSPMNLSPTSPYAGGPQPAPPGTYTSFSPQQATSARQSPTRTNPYMSPPQSYYSPPGKAES